jgi:hypothetical protein
VRDAVHKTDFALPDCLGVGPVLKVLQDLRIVAARIELWGGPPGPQPTPSSARLVAAQAAPYYKT